MYKRQPLNFKEQLAQRRDEWMLKGGRESFGRLAPLPLSEKGRTN